MQDRQEPAPQQQQQPHPAHDSQGRLLVYLNAYDVTNTQDADTNGLVVKINNFTHPLGLGGIFHGGIEVRCIAWVGKRGRFVQCLHEGHGPECQELIGL